MEMGLGSPGGSSWGMEKAGFGEAWVLAASQQPLWFERYLGALIWRSGGIALEMGLGTPGGTCWEMEKAGFSESRVCDVRQWPLWLGRHLGEPF